MNPKDIGTLGEHIGILELLRNNIVVSRPIGDNSQYDLIIDVKGALLRCQVKTKTTGNSDKVEFSLNTTNRSGDRVRYTEVDCFLLIDIVNNRVFLVDYREDRTSMIIRYAYPNNGIRSTVNFHEDFTIEKFVESMP